MSIVLQNTKIQYDSGLNLINSGVSPAVSVDNAGFVKEYDGVIAFRAGRSSSENITDTRVITSFNSVSLSNLFQKGTGYNTSTGRFTAPKAGAYLFYAHVWRPPGSLSGAVLIRQNGSTFLSEAREHVASSGSGERYSALTTSVIVELQVNDYVELISNATAVTAPVTIHIADRVYNTFWGYYLG